MQPPREHVAGPFTSPEHIEQLCGRVDVITVEIEHVDALALLELEKKYQSTGGRSGKGVAIHPSPEVILIIQDKYTQKVHLTKHNIPLADAVAIESGKDNGASSVAQAAQNFGLPLMLKSRTMAYDGRGNYLLRSEDQIPAAIEALGAGKRALYAERFAPFVREVAVMVVRSADGTVRSYPPVETVHRDNICHLVHAPLCSRKPGQSMAAKHLAEKAISALGNGAVGIFGVEMFELEDGMSTLCAERILTRELTALT